MAFREYEAKLRPFLEEKQASALRMLDFFAPKTSLRLTIRDLSIHAMAIPFLANAILGSNVRDDLELPSY